MPADQHLRIADPLGHCIDETILINRRSAKKHFRQSILQAWDCSCAYCGKTATTLDHVRARSKGGETTRQNLISCCSNCNSRKGSTDWVSWFRRQSFWSAENEATIWLWLHQDDEIDKAC
jgi:5-methylcytosine-specific restriction endonuclease McrA